ncbi:MULTISPECIES: trypsin-like peptidase domain-containing protein [Microvirga]|uniref:trypsin-like peptidase domain-containing protein n=1 Tax=Microvirga TaxID=186650 RepID=UPI001689DFB3|nr:MULTISPECIES: trypsin-like peptidase domain-containing protein [Microvirga]MBD2750928.1 trypsin-like peptidase domain-containing protein [Microvirga sp.]
MGTLTEKQKKALREALLYAFPERDIYSLLRSTFGINPRAVIQVPGRLDYELFQVVMWAEDKGRTEDLVSQVIKRKPALAEILKLAGFETQAVYQTSPAPTLNIPAASSAHEYLERATYSGQGIFTLDPFIQRFLDLRGQVCHITGSKSGTGFLVAPDLVLTNFHVVEVEIAQSKGANIACRFDYLSEAQRGTVFRLKEGDCRKWCLAYSRYSSGDLGSGGQSPTLQQLDYALLRLSEPVGAMLSTSGARREWVKLQGTMPIPNAEATLQIIQHPENRPLSYSVGRSLGVTAEKVRLRYTTETKIGSSGSPVFNAELSLVALHHAAEPGPRDQPGEYNQGIPIQVIVSDLIEKKVNKFWE